MTTSVGSLARLHDRLAVILAATLRIPIASVGPSVTFASLGMDSLASVELTTAIQDALGIDLELSAVHEYPDLDSLCRFIERGPTDALTRRDRLIADALLPDDIRPGPLAPFSTRDARSVLLTGATGFVGAYLLRTLLDETTAAVHCLVRPGDTDGLTRVRRNLAGYDLWSPTDSTRIVIVNGDLARPSLGLGPDGLRALTSRVESIYHAGADVDWVRAYGTLRDTNVLGTRELLRFACQGRAKPFHFLSSTSVFHSSTGARVVDERADAWAGVDGLRLGYAQSKCVAESLVRSAGERGLPVTIIRSSLASGDSTTGRANVDDFVSRLIAGCVRMHAAPDLDWRVDCVPVDDVAHAVVRLTLAHEQGIEVSHLTAARPWHWREIVLSMRLRGYDVELLPYAEWSDVLRATDDATHPLQPLRAFFLHVIADENHLTLPELLEESRRSSVDATRTRLRLDALGVPPREWDTAHLSCYVDHLVERGSIPAPSHSFRPQPLVEQDLLPEASEAFSEALSTWLRTRVRVNEIVLTPMTNAVASLTAWRANSRGGVYRARASVVDCAGATSDVALFVKSKVADDSSIAVVEAIAALSSPSLGETVTRFRDDLGLTRSHLRELALYSSDDRRLRDHMPHPVLIERDEARNHWLLVLESVDTSLLPRESDSWWDSSAIDVVLTGLANVHSASYRCEPPPESDRWLAPRLDGNRRVAMTPLWAALLEHAVEHSAAWSDGRLRRIHERLIRDISSWSFALDSTPRTLIHNQFYPRNIALRRSRDGGRLCAFDWELATIGAPQRDLAELLCFVLPPDASQATIARWVERYRLQLVETTGVQESRGEWELGFSAVLCALLVDRLAWHAMMGRVRPQRFLSRVARSWLNVFRRFPWTA